MNVIHQKFSDRGLVRPREGRLLAGVCAGLGRRFGLTPWQARAFFALLLLLPGTQIVLYPILWVLMPDEVSAFAPASTFSGPGSFSEPLSQQPTTQQPTTQQPTTQL